MEEKRQNKLDADDLRDIVTDLEAIEGLLTHLEASGYFLNGEDGLTFRAIKGSVRHTRDKLENLVKSMENTEQNI